MNYWLMKSEPTECSVDDALAAPKATVPWVGVRNYKARNFMRDGMRVGDGVMIYHSNCKVPGIAGLARVASTAYPDETQFDPKSHYHDAKASREQPRWFLVDVAFERKLGRMIPLEEIRQYTDELGEGFALTARGSRLSVFPVTTAQWKLLLSLE